MNTVSLGTTSSDAWLHCVLANFNEFLIDHAANERKASAMAMSLVAHYPDRHELVRSMIELALEELNHFRQVIRLMQERQLVMAGDEKDPYVNQMRAHVRSGPKEYFLDRLLSGALIEARGEERFLMISKSLKDLKLKSFYRRLAISEKGHHATFIRLAKEYFNKRTVDQRLSDWVAIERNIIEQLPVRSRLH